MFNALEGFFLGKIARLRTVKDNLIILKEKLGFTLELKDIHN